MKRALEEWEAEVADAVRRGAKDQAISKLDQECLFAEVPDKLRMLQTKFDLVASNEDKAAVLDQKFRLVVSNEDKAAVLDQKLGFLRIMQEANNSRSLLETKIDLIAKLAPLVPDEHREALQQESKRAAAELDRLLPFHVAFVSLHQSAPSALLDRLTPWVIGAQNHRVLMLLSTLAFCGSAFRRRRWWSLAADMGKISIDFMVLDLAMRTRVVKIILDVAEQCASSVAMPHRLREALSPIVKQNVEETTLTEGWCYVRRAGSPETKLYTAPAPASAASTLELELPRGAAKKARSESSSSSGHQTAHVLFTGEISKDPMLMILASLGENRYQGAQQEFGRLLNLTFQLDYRTHQDYDNFRFFYAWNFSQSVDGWVLQTQPRLTRPYLGEEPQLAQVPLLSQEDHVLWRHALALRKALALANADHKVNTEVFRSDWESDLSSCWS